MRLSSALTMSRLVWCLPGLAVMALTGCGTTAHLLTTESPSAPSVSIVTPVPVSPVALPASPSIAATAVDDALAAAARDDQRVAADPAAQLVAAEAVGLSDEVDAAPAADTSRASAKAEPATAEKDEYDVEEYDPWEPFNERVFEFNRQLDRYILKPVAKGYDKVVPDEVQRMIDNWFDNLDSFRRMFNSLLQAKWDGAARELSRFLLNSTVGVGGLFDIAKHEGIQKSREDFGQTLGFYGIGQGPYLVLPLMQPLTVRDGIGKAVDGFIDPLAYLLPFVWERLFLSAESLVNERSLNLELFQGFEETVVDMYSAVRHAYLERRKNLVKE